MKITIETTETKGFAIAHDGEIKAGEMTFSIAGPHLMIIDHTEVADAFKGKSIGKQLLMAIVEKARKEKIKIIPLCPYANAMFKKIESIRDVL